MIARPDECDARQLSRMLDDELTVQEQLDVERHLDHCQSCRQQLEEMTAEESWWADTQDALLHLGDTKATQLQVLPKTPLTTSQSSRVDQSSIGTDSEPRRPGVEVTAEVTLQVHDACTPDEIGSQHWVMELLSLSDDPDCLGEVDSMQVHRVVGQGGMGVVLKARDKYLHRFLAIKLLSPMLASTGAARQRFLREAQAAAAVVHPNIVPIYAVSTERRIPYLVMPFVAGGNLQQYLDEMGPLPLERTLSIGLQVAEGLSAAHGQGIVHRDIKPANLMLDEGGFRVMLTDFGLARALDNATLTASGLVAGTPQFMSPEQSRGASVDNRSDIYSLGAVLYALATGRPPVQGQSTLEMLRRIGEEKPVPIWELNESYPAWFQQLVELLMHKEPSDRPQSAEHTADILRACLAYARTPQHTVLPLELRRKQGRFSFLAMAATCLTVLGIAGIFLAQNAFRSSGQSRAPERLGEEIGPPLREMGAQPASSQPLAQTISDGYSIANTGEAQAMDVRSSDSLVPGASIFSWECQDIEISLYQTEAELNALQQELQGAPPSSKLGNDNAWERRPSR